jgi:rhamnogalacturonan endolyase
MKHLFTMSLSHPKGTLCAALGSLALLCAAPCATALAQPAYNYKKLQLESLNRGIVAIRTGADSVMVSWRYLREDPSDVRFTLYRDDTPILTNSAATNFVDALPAGTGATYRITASAAKGKVVKRLREGSWTLAADAPVGYIEIPLDPPAGGKTPVVNRNFDKKNPDRWPNRPAPTAQDSAFAFAPPQPPEGFPQNMGAAPEMQRPEGFPQDSTQHPEGVMPRRRGPRNSPWMNTSNTYTYSVGDGSMGDVDGDGEYEYIVKWDPSNAHDNSHFGYTGNVFMDCYKLDGRCLWRIDLGRNIRAGAHYTQFMVYDLDGDGRAEVVMKTADGTIDGRGTVIGDSTADYRNSAGYVLDGPEFLTVFSGETGAALYTTNYQPERGSVEAWGDKYGNRCDRFLAAVAYLDGKHPSVVMCRGYYTRTVLVAWDWDGHRLRHRWTFDTDTPRWNDYRGQGNHNLRVADVDGDGKDEIIYGAMAVDHDGNGLYTTGMGHGDALHLTAFSPYTPELQVWDCHENHRDGSSLRDARTGKIIFQQPSPDDVGRCMAADIDPTSPGVEMWSLDSHGVRNYRGDSLYECPRGLSYNMAVWWDGDLLRELLDGNRVSKFDWKQRCVNTLTTFEGCRAINGTKNTPVLQGDMIGDWREEVLMRTADNRALRLYVTPYPTTYRFWSFVQDPVYRISIATQNVAYNQPTQPGFYFGPDLKSGASCMGTVMP